MESWQEPPGALSRVPVGSLGANLATANPYGFRFFHPAMAPRMLDVTGAAYDPVTQIFRKADGTALFWGESQPDAINPGDPSADTTQPTQTYYLSDRKCVDTNNDGYIVQDCTDTFDPNPPDSEPDH